MCSCDGFLEVYKQDLTYRIQTRETIDPDRTNPHARFVAAVVRWSLCRDPENLPDPN